jgi:hypothetical protein
MALRVIIGDYHTKPDDIIVSDWQPEVIKKHSFDTKKKTVVLYAEHLGLKRSDFEFIAKNTTGNVVVVCETKKTMNGVRKTKGMTIEYTEGYCEEQNPFDVAKLILTATDRQYVYDFLSYNKVQMWMPVRILGSYAPDCKNKMNIKHIAWLDQYLYRVKPDILYAYAAFKIEAESPRTYFKWRFPKKKEEDGESK